MATLGKLLSLCCFGAAGLVGLNVLYALGTADLSNEVAANVFVLLVGAQVVVALLLATVGAVAWVVGDVAQREGDLRAGRRAARRAADAYEDE